MQVRSGAQRAWRLVRTLVREADDDRLPGLAAETAFFAVLSVFPGLLVAVSLLGLLDVVVGTDVAAMAQERVVGALQLVLTDSASEVVRAVEDLFESSRGSLLTVATVGALVTLSGGFAVAVNALNLAYDASESRSWLRRRLLGLVLALGSLVLLVLALAAVVVGPLLGRGERLADLLGLGDVFVFVWDVLRVPVLGLVLLAWLTTMYAVAPARHVRWRDALPGAVLTVVLWLVASAGLRVYVEVVADRNPVLGAFGGGIIVMTWAYLLSLALLVGGELNAVLHDERRAATGDAGQLALFPHEGLDTVSRQGAQS
ncbi:MAG TPA: YihY/virulence factor BrkB family protein [Mycobacteriales bacterium]|nr:YihY/virulence factor BrkB family protein [Mycobacteriales bacterium]